MRNNEIKVTNNTGQINIAIGDQIKQLISKINASNDTPNVLKQELEQLSKQVEAMIPALPEEVSKDVIQDLDTFVTEATKEKPRRKWWQLSADGLRQAAENVNEIGKPVIETIGRILILLGPLSI